MNSFILSHRILLSCKIIPPSMFPAVHFDQCCFTELSIYQTYSCHIFYLIRREEERGKEKKSVLTETIPLGRED